VTIQEQSDILGQLEVPFATGENYLRRRLKGVHHKWIPPKIQRKENITIPTYVATLFGGHHPYIMNLISDIKFDLT
jgi:hypothetical protein